jgi:hypothetical protein
MHMEAFLWMFLPVFVAGGSALLSFYIMQARMEVARVPGGGPGDHQLPENHDGRAGTGG